MIIIKAKLLISVLEAYRSFDKREDGWLKVELVPEMAEAHVR